MARAEPGASLQGRIRGLVHGVALGDAMGAPVEKLSAAEIRHRYGRVTSLAVEWHRMSESPDERNGRVRGNGIVTDDTLMTLALMAVYREVGRHLDAWDMAGPMVRQIAWTPRWIPELGREAMLLERLFYPEKWIFQRHQLAGCDPREGGIGNMINCGAAMYAAPIGVVNAGAPRAAYDEAIAFMSGHQASYGLEAAGVMAAAVAAAMIPGATAASIVEHCLAVAKDGTRAAIAEIAEAAATPADHATMTDTFHKILSRYSSMGDDIGRRPEQAGQPSENYRPSRLRTIEELPIALGFILVNDGAFRPAIEDGINSGRDTDSIGSMIGAILGALHGETVIAEEEGRLLAESNRIDFAAEADGFAAVATAIIERDLSAARAREAQLRGLLDTTGPRLQVVS